MDVDTIGKRLKKMRKDRNLTQDTVASIIPMDKTGYSRIENDKTELRIEHCIKLSAFYNVSCDYILLGIETENIDFCRKTGLSNETAKYFMKNKKEPGFAKLIDILVQNHSLISVAFYYERYVAVKKILLDFRQNGIDEKHNSHYWINLATKASASAFFDVAGYIDKQISIDKYLKLKYKDRSTEERLTEMRLEEISNYCYFILIESFKQGIQGGIEYAKKGDT